MATRLSDAGLPVETQAYTPTVSENLGRLAVILREIRESVGASYNAIHGSISGDEGEPKPEGIHHQVEHLIRLAEFVKAQSYRVFTSLDTDYSVAKRNG
jgi:fructose-bisphosphate aldolase class 1